MVFGAANAYLGMKAGQTVAATLPAAVIAMALFRLPAMRGTLLEQNITRTAASVGEALVAGAIVTEQIFSWNGLGQLIVTSSAKRDTPVVLALTLMTGLAVVIGNILADIGYRAVDPRIRF